MAKHFSGNGRWPGLLVRVLAGSVLFTGLARAADTNSPWEHIVVVGASASAGYSSEPQNPANTHPQYPLGRYLDAALTAPHPRARNLANAMFFAQPEVQGRSQIDDALKAGPTLVVGVDFLFWFCYGDGANDEARLKRFEQGLKLLEPIQCPLIVGDIPDASAASRAMLGDEQIPSAPTMAAANRRLQEWAAGRSNVAIVPLSAFMRSAASDGPVTVHNYTLPQGQTRILLQADNLHPSPPGSSVLALAALDALLARQPGRPADEVRWDPKAVYHQVYPAPPVTGSSSTNQAAAPPPAGK
jgi:hypothetical protein